MTAPFIETSRHVEDETSDRQQRNTLWWETKPMTYADWGAHDRLPTTEAEFRAIEEYVLRTGPWLKAWFGRADLDGLDCFDLGCGSGIFSTMLARRGGRVTAMDLTQAGVDLARRTADVFGVHINTVRGDAENMPFADGRFDFVYSWGVLHHTSDMAAAVRQMGRVTKPNGRGMMMVYHRHSVVYYLHGLFWLIFRGKLLKGHSLRSVQDFYTDGYFHRYLTRTELKAMLAEAGLTVQRFSIAQYEKKILPCLPASVDAFLKRRFGMCLIAEWSKPA